MSEVTGQALREWLDRVPLRRRAVDWLRSQPVDTYLVGGSVRDALLGRQSDDLDIAVAGVGHTATPALRLARAVADRLGGAFYTLDARRDVGRIVCVAQGRRWHIDVAGLRAPDILGDLRARDLTVNAMAVPLAAGLDELLDPTRGLEDLREGRLRAVSERAFSDDPVRALRVVRLRSALGFRVTAETERLTRAGVPGLARISPERVRDELVLILSLPEVASALRYADDLGIWPHALPEIVDHRGSAGAATRRVGAVERALGAWRSEGASASVRWDATLARYRRALASRWSEELAPGRSRWTLLLLSALLSVAPDPRAAGARMRLSSREVRALAGLTSAAEDLLAGGLAEAPAALDVYRFFRRHGDAGVEGAALALALGSTETQASKVDRLLEGWFERQDEWVSPPVLVDGRDVLRQTGVGGPMVGRLLEEIREAQVQGQVRTREEALARLAR